MVSVCAEVNPHAAHKRHDQGWVDEIHDDLDVLIPRIRKAVEGGSAGSDTFSFKIEKKDGDK